MPVTLFLNHAGRRVVAEGGVPSSEGHASPIPVDECGDRHSILRQEEVRNMRRRIFSLQMRYLAALAIIGMFAVLEAGTATANPPGIINVGKKIANFNIIATPNAWVANDSLCPNNGSRIFFRRGTSPWTITWNFDPLAHGFDIVDCDG